MDAKRKVLLVANSGGHLQQLALLDERLPFAEDRLWVTSDTPQSRSLLADREVVFVPNVGSRDYRGLARNASTALRLIRGNKLAAVVSTGSGQALAYLPPAALRGIPTHYIESATRTDGPSFTGKALERVPRVRLHTQHERWAGSRWSYAGSVFDGFEVRNDGVPKPIKRVVVSLGTSSKYGFRRLVEKVASLLPADAEVLWQTGCTEVADIGIHGRDQVPMAELSEAIQASDLLVAHAGTGIALSAFVAGISPVLVPREFAHGEHVDDHQSLTGDLLRACGLAVVSSVDDLNHDSFAEAASRRVDFRPENSAALQLGI